MYRDQKPSKSIVTTEAHTRRHEITLSAAEAHNALTWAAMNKAGLTPTMRNPQSQTESVSAEVNVWESFAADPCEMNYVVTIIENLSEPAIVDFAPPNIEEAVRLTRHGPPIVPQLTDDLYTELKTGIDQPILLPDLEDGSPLTRSFAEFAAQIKAEGEPGNGAQLNDTVFTTDGQEVEVLRLTGTGTWGMGTTNPMGKLEIVTPGFVGLPIPTARDEICIPRELAFRIVDQFLDNDQWLWNSPISSPQHPIASPATQKPRPASARTCGWRI